MDGGGSFVFATIDIGCSTNGRFVSLLDAPFRDTFLPVSFSSPCKLVGVGVRTKNHGIPHFWGLRGLTFSFYFASTKVIQSDIDCVAFMRSSPSQARAISRRMPPGVM